MAAPSASAARSARVDENLAAAEALRAEGLALFHAGEVPQAMFRWHSMLMHLNGIDQNPSSAMGYATGGMPKQSSLSAPQQAAVRELLIAAHSNLSLGLLKARARGRCLDDVPQKGTLPVSLSHTMHYAEGELRA